MGIGIKINNVVISGYVPRDLYRNESNTYAAFTVGIDDSYKAADGNWVNRTYWIPVKIFAKEQRILRLAEKIKKGVSVMVIGSMCQSSYKDRNNNTINEVFVKVSDRGSIQITSSYGNNTRTVSQGSKATNETTSFYEGNPYSFSSGESTETVDFNYDGIGDDIY